MSEDALVSYIVNKIGDLFTQEIPLIWKVADDIESLRQELQALEIFLNNMDYKQRQDATTKNWLSSVRDVAYEAEDLIDTYSLEKRYAPATRIFHSCSVNKQIEELKSKIREIVERRTIYVPNLPEQRGLNDMGRQLCRKCAGLPLALVVLGGLVSTKLKHPLVWSKLLDNMNWDSTDDGRLCLEILALSYYDLPYNIKFCFLYLGAFPHGSQISASKLTKLWIGDDLIPKEEGITLEDTVTNYLEELAQRCLVEIVKRGANMSIKKVRVHDLLGELAKSEVRESRFLQVKNLTTTEEMSKPQEIAARRMALHQNSTRLPLNFCVKNQELF